jgi:DNA invertase Pin-like site-specific DNA recombinase
MSTPISAAIYTRISKDQKNGQGVTRQETLCRKLAQEKGWEVAGIYTDNDLSAYSGKRRPAYEQMLEDLRSGVVNAVICVDLDRLTRRPAELEEFITIADQTGAHLANVSGEVDLSTSDGRFRARIMGAVARQESEKKSERILRANDQRRAEGAPHTGGYRPYGYQPARTATGSPTWHIVPKEAERIHAGVDAHLRGVSLNQIAREWNDAGARTTRGNLFSASTVKRVLINPLYAGLLQLGRETRPGNWPPIIERADHEAIWAKIESRRGQGQGGGRPPKHLLTGMVRCRYCGAALYRRVSIRRIPAYVHVARPETDPCQHPGLSADARSLEEHVSRLVAERLDSPSVRTEMNRPLADATLAKLEQAEKALSTLTHDRYVREIVTERHYMEASMALNEQIAFLTEELATPPAQLPEGDPLTVWGHERTTTQERHRIVSSLIDHIAISEGTAGEFDPNRVEVIWR